MGDKVNIEPLKSLTNVKFNEMCELAKKIFKIEEENLFLINPIFVDISLDGDIGKTEPSVRIFVKGDEGFFGDKKYFDESSKYIEVYNKKLLKKSKLFKRQFKRQMGQYSEIQKKY